MRLKVLLPILFSFLTIISHAQNKTWTCINEEGKTVFTVEAYYVYDFSNGLAKIKKYNLVNNAWRLGYGYLDSLGKIVIECNLEEAQDFEGDFSWVKRKGDEHYTLIDKTGNVIPTKKYTKVGPFYEGQTDICAVYENKKMGFINTQGREITPCKYTGSRYFSEGLACVSLYDGTTENYGFLNKQGEFAIPMQFNQGGTSSFENGMARASVVGKTVLIDRTGKVAFKTTHGNIQGVHGDYISVFKGRNRTDWGWVNFKDEVVIPQIYDYAKNFNEDGLAVVETDKLQGLIDTTGKMVIPMKYASIYENLTANGFIVGVYPSEESQSLMNATKDYYDAEFNLLDLSAYKYVSHANGNELLTFMGSNELWGYLNRDFEVVIPAQFTKVNPFNSGLAWVR